ncbi:MAG: bifunctional methylenetetrahydrofolate dehydrogenase/methenyltetrahydrofolate cyclohydrolase FolD [Vallitalea sp.]|nr:bifunctional methylenetetrahydrofolate dehydrogenase/methenyltetrahydrofolate cyclohydrolase FolD [Vallitalea sp.]
MSAVKIDGRKVSAEIKDELISSVKDLKEKGINPTLAVVLVGNDPASQVYVKHKKKACEYVGIRSLAYELDENTSEDELLKLVNELNTRDDVHGILVQLPLPKHIDEEKILLAIDPSKDVDGFHPYSVGNLSIGRDGFVSCTPAGIIELIKRYNIEIEGKNCVVIGRSNIVGKPVSMLLLRENGTVTICHSRTKNIKEICKQADILVVAIGRANFVTKDFIKEGATVIDVGMNRLDNGKLCGDVSYDECATIAGAITPVPGGVGPMTIAMLMNNCVKSAGKCLT